MSARDGARESGELLISANGIVDSELGFDPPDATQVEICRVYIRRFKERTKTIRKKDSSYGLKHEVERWTKVASGESGRRVYISNGAFITAAIAEGYAVEPVRESPNSPNAFFNMAPRAAESRRAGVPEEDYRKIVELIERDEANWKCRTGSKEIEQMENGTTAAQVGPVVRLVGRKRPESVRPYVVLFSQYPHAGIETNARNETDFMKMLSQELLRVLEAWPDTLGEKQATLEAWLAHALDIGCRLRGYKAEDVIESRVLYRGDLRPTEDAIVAIGTSDGADEP